MAHPVNRDPDGQRFVTREKSQTSAAAAPAPGRPRTHLTISELALSEIEGTDGCPTNT